MYKALSPTPNRLARIQVTVVWPQGDQEKTPSPGLCVTFDIMSGSKPSFDRMTLFPVSLGRFAHHFNGALY